MKIKQIEALGKVLNGIGVSWVPVAPRVEIDTEYTGDDIKLIVSGNGENGVEWIHQSQGGTIDFTTGTKALYMQAQDTTNSYAVLVCFDTVANTIIAKQSAYAAIPDQPVLKNYEIEITRFNVPATGETIEPPPVEEPEVLTKWTKQTFVSRTSDTQLILSGDLSKYLGGGLKVNSTLWGIIINLSYSSANDQTILTIGGSILPASISSVSVCNHNDVLKQERGFNSGTLDNASEDIFDDEISIFDNEINLPVIAYGTQKLVYVEILDSSGGAIMNIRKNAGTTDLLSSDLTIGTDEDSGVLMSNTENSFVFGDRVRTVVKTAGTDSAAGFVVYYYLSE